MVPVGTNSAASFPEYLRRPLLQPIHRRVFAVDVVSHLCLGHRAAHRLRRLGYGVAAQVNRIHYCYLSSICLSSGPVELDSIHSLRQFTGLAPFLSTILVVWT